MGYFYMSNINDFSKVSNPSLAYQEIEVYENDSSQKGIITFTDNNLIDQKASFLMIRAHMDNSLLVQLYPYEYGVYIPAGELWAVDSIDKVEKIIIRKIFDTEGSELTEGKIQWMIGYK